MSECTNYTEGLGGNTTVPKPKFRGRRWCFTLNNYSEKTLKSIIHTFKDSQFIIGKEIGESGTPHLQGYVEFKNGKSFATMQKNLPGAHIEKAKGSREQNLSYCSKDHDFVTNIKCKETRLRKLLKKYDGVTWKRWQQDVIDIINTEPDSRTIHWFWENKGCVGKSFLAKYIGLKYNALIASGKKNDIFNLINNRVNIEEKDLILVMLDIPRHNLEYVNYGMLEEIKNGMLVSGKYEGGVCYFDHPHLIVFANKPPDYEAMSNDRWNVVEIENN